jgi:hypothetical protein
MWCRSRGLCQCDENRVFPVAVRLCNVLIARVILIAVWLLFFGNEKVYCVARILQRTEFASRYLLYIRTQDREFEVSYKQHGK